MKIALVYDEKNPRKNVSIIYFIPCGFLLCSSAVFSLILKTFSSWTVSTGFVYPNIKSHFTSLTVTCSVQEEASIESVSWVEIAAHCVSRYPEVEIISPLLPLQQQNLVLWFFEWISVSSQANVLFPSLSWLKKLDLVTLSGVGKLGKQLCLVVIYCNSRYFHTFADYNITRSQVWSKLFSYVQHQQIARIRSLYSSNEQFMNNFIVVFNAKLTNEVNCETWPRVYLMLSLKNDHKNCIICWSE